MEIAALRAFRAVAHDGGFTRAAERLNSTQSTVSWQIKRLEAQIGRSLVSRNRRGASLTEAGVGLLYYAERILELHDTALGQLKHGGLAGRVRLGASEDLTSYGLSAVLARFSRRFPDIELTISVDLSARLQGGLGDGSFDLVVGQGSMDATGGQLLWREPLAWVGREALPFAGDEPLALVTFGEGCNHRRAAIDALRACGRRWRTVIATPSLAGVRAAVADGLGVSVLNARMMGAGLVRLTEGAGWPTLPETDYRLNRRPGPLPAPAAALADAILEALPAPIG